MWQALLILLWYSGMVTSELHLESALEILVTIATKWCMKLNYGKTKLMSLIESSRTPCPAKMTHDKIKLLFVGHQ